MPEFRLRRRKGKSEQRRHTLHNDKDVTSQLQEAARMYEEQTEIILGPNEISVDDAVEHHFRTKPGRGFEAFVNGPSSSEPPVKAIANRRISSKYSDCIYLRHGADMRRCPLPSPITLSTIKQLFINLFDLSPSIDKDPTWHLFILDRSNTWKLLYNISNVHDQCTLLLVDSTELSTSPLPAATIIHRSSTGTPDDASSDDNDSVTLHDPIVSLSERGQPEGTNHLTASVSEPSVYIPFTNDRGSPSNELVEQLTKDIVSLKARHQMEMQSVKTELNLARQLLIKEDISTVSGVSAFRRERLNVEPLKEEYLRDSEVAVNEMSSLQSIGEALKVDAIHHRSRIDSDEIETLLTMLNESTKTFASLQERYNTISSKLKEVMQKELQVIVSEEQVIAEEASKLKTATEACNVLYETFTTLQQLAQIQAHRPVQVPVIHTVSEPDQSALLASINSIDPNHEDRIAAIKETESNMTKRRNDLISTKRALRMFELSLQHRQHNLRQTEGGLDAVEKQKDENLKVLYMEEKLERQREIEKDIELAQKALRDKRKQEITEVEQRLEFTSLREERKKDIELAQLEEEKKQLIEERRSQEEERVRLDGLRQQQVEHQRKLKEEQRRQEDERRKIELEKLQQLEERRKIEDDRRQWHDYHIRISSESPETRIKRKELLWQHVQSQIQLENEQKQVSDMKILKAHTMKGSLSLSDSYFDKTQFHEAENMSSFPIPAVVASRSHRELWFNPERSKSIELTRKLAPVVSSNEFQRFSQTDNLPKFSSSEDSLVKQNLYDSPWTSKKLLLTQNRRDTIGSNHTRHKSDVNVTPPTSLKLDPRENQTPSPSASFNPRHTLVSTSHDLSHSTSIRSNEDIERQVWGGYSSNSPLNYTPPTLTNGNAPPPPYSQVVVPAHTMTDRTTHYPLAVPAVHLPTEPKYKPSISYV